MSLLVKLAQAQLNDSDLQQIIDCKKQREHCHMPNDPNLQKYAPVWDQLHVQGSSLVRVPQHVLMLRLRYT